MELKKAAAFLFENRPELKKYKLAKMEPHHPPNL